MRDRTYAAPQLRMSRVSRVSGPLTIQQLRRQCEVVPDLIDSDGQAYHEDDTLLIDYQEAAVAAAEAFTGLAIAPGEFMGYADSLPGRYVELPIAPLDSVVSFVLGYGTDAVDLTDADYTVDVTELLPRIYPATSWPSFTKERNGVQVRVIAGYGLSTDSPDCPADILQAIRLTVGVWYKDREANSDTSELPIPAQNLLRPHRIRLGMA